MMLRVHGMIHLRSINRGRVHRVEQRMEDLTVRMQLPARVIRGVPQVGKKSAPRFCAVFNSPRSTVVDIELVRGNW